MLNAGGLGFPARHISTLRCTSFTDHVTLKYMNTMLRLRHFWISKESLTQRDTHACYINDRNYFFSLSKSIFIFIFTPSRLNILMLYAFFWVIPRRLRFICRSFGTLCLFHLHRQVVKMEETECSETSAYKLQMPGNYPEESIQHSEHGESLNILSFGRRQNIVRRTRFCLVPNIVQSV